MRTIHPTKNRLWAVLGLFLTASLPSPSIGQPVTYIGRVVGVSDGDTIVLLDGQLQQYRIRFAEIDAPESNQPFGRVSKQSMSELAHNRMATAECASYDHKHKRPVCRVFVDGIDLNLLQVQRGLAWAADGFVRDQRIIDAHQQAKEAQRGLWVDPRPIPPWLWRKGVR